MKHHSAFLNDVPDRCTHIFLIPLSHSFVGSFLPSRRWPPTSGCDADSPTHPPCCPAHSPITQGDARASLLRTTSNGHVFFPCSSTWKPNSSVWDLRLSIAWPTHIFPFPPCFSASHTFHSGQVDSLTESQHTICFSITESYFSDILYT